MQPTIRPVHYHAHGRHAMRLPCYQAELTAHLASGRVNPGSRVPWASVYDLPQPRRTTDVSRVTCRECIRTLHAMLRVKLAKP